MLSKMKELKKVHFHIAYWYKIDEKYSKVRVLDPNQKEYRILTILDRIRNSWMKDRYMYSTLYLVITVLSVVGGCSTVGTTRADRNPSNKTDEE